MMLHTEEQCERSRKMVLNTEKHLEEQSRQLAKEGLPAANIKRLLDPTRCFVGDMQHDVEEFEGAKHGRIQPFDDLSLLGRRLISVRIARGLSQKELSEKLNVPESQVISDEENEYHGISFLRAQTILSALSATLEIKITLERCLCSHFTFGLLERCLCSHFTFGLGRR